MLSDARRALVALNTPAEGPADTTAVDYWQAWRPPEPGDEVELWSTRIAASVHGGLPGISFRYAETAAAAGVAAGRVLPDNLIGTQAGPPAGPRLERAWGGGRRVLLLVLHLDRPGPADRPLAEVRRVLEGRYGRPLPGRWDDATAARRSTGREPLSAEDRAELGAAAAVFPLSG